MCIIYVYKTTVKYSCIYIVRVTYSATYVNPFVRRGRDGNGEKKHTEKNHSSYRDERAQNRANRQLSGITNDGREIIKRKKKGSEQRSGIRLYRVIKRTIVHIMKSTSINTYIRRTDVSTGRRTLRYKHSR